MYAVSTTELLDDGKGAVKALRGREVAMSTDDGRPAFTPVPGSEFDIPGGDVIADDHG